MTTTSAPSIQPGDVVRFSGQWLHGTGSYTGPLGQMRGVVLEVKGGSAYRLARVRWDRAYFNRSRESSVLCCNLQRRTSKGWEPRSLP
jgi:hypothetical protein